MKKIFVFNGVHGSGKSTLAKLITQQNKDLVYFHEIGGQLRQEVEYNSLQSSEDFDNEVMRRELLRDNQLFSCLGTPVVETWHTGNIGYVAARSPRLLDDCKRLLSKQLEIFEPRCVLVEVGWDIFRQRVTEKISPNQMEQLIDFYKIISEQTQSLYDEFNIRYFTVKNEGSLQEGLKRLSDGFAMNGVFIEGSIPGKERL